MTAKEDYDNALVELAWSLWGEVGVATNKRSHTGCALDLELLVAFTEHLDDPRLRTESRRALQRIQPYTSASRLTKARRLLPGAVQRDERVPALRSRPELAPLRLRRNSLVQLRLRAIVGNSARAEIFLALLLKQPAVMSVSEIADSALLVKSIVAKATSEMHDAGVLEVTRERNRLRYAIVDPLALNTLVGSLPTRAPNWARIFSMLLAGRTAFASHEEGSITLAIALSAIAAEQSRTLAESLPRGVDVLSRARVSRAWVDMAYAIAAGSSPELDTFVTAGHNFNVDSLTGLMNHRAARTHLAQMLRAPEPVALLLMDIDHFKRINDAYGHQIGDGLLTQLAGIIAESAARDDSAIACRYAGEEFLVAVAMEPHDAEQFAEQLCARIASRKFSIDMHEIAATVSIGLATTEADRTSLDVESQLERADAALHEAKRRGRNRVAVAPPDERHASVRA